MKLNKLTAHPDNNKIYSPTDLDDLEKSLSEFGQLEPIAITKKNKIISGHRRFQAMTNLGWKECDVRIIEPENEIISLIEHNRHRQKTTSDILNEARFLEREVKEYVGSGRNARKRTGKKKGKRLRTAHELAQKLGLGTTKLKQILSISNYEPKLIDKIDRGELSVSKAYELVRTKYIQKKPRAVEDNFSQSFKKLLEKEKPSLEVVNKTLRETYPYCLEHSDIDEERRLLLKEHMDYLKKLNSREMMLVQKRDELENAFIIKKQFDEVRNLLPSFDELFEFFKDTEWWTKYELIVAGKGKFDTRLWNTTRTCIHSQENSTGVGRHMNAFVGFKNKKGFRLLGLISFHSDSRTLTVRDEHIGWTTAQNKKHRERIVNMNTCVPTQPFGFNFLGGKFLAMVATELVEEWNKKYKTTLVGITTTSLFGSKSQYQSLKYWKHLGTSSGKTLIKPLEEEWSFWRQWLKDYYPDIHEKVMSESSPKQRAIQNVLRILNIKSTDYYHSHKRGVFFFSLYQNSREFLTDQIKEKDLEPHNIMEFHAWKNNWYLKSKGRVNKLNDEKKLQKDILFHESITESEIELWLSSRGIT